MRLDWNADVDELDAADRHDRQHRLALCAFHHFIK